VIRLDEEDVNEFEEVPTTTSRTPVDQQLEYEDVLWRIYLQLKGKMVIGDQILDLGDPLLSDTGIQYVMKVLNGYLHKGMVLANLDADMIRKMSFWAGYYLATAMLLDYERVGSPSPAVVDNIVNLVFDNIYATLTRALNGRTAEGLKEIVKVQSVKILEKGKKPSFLLGGGD
jgi:hypothetical protein